VIAAGLIDAPKSVEQVRQMLGGNPNSGILNLDHRLGRAAVEANGDGAPTLGVLKASGDQVGEQTLELASIAVNIGVSVEFKVEVDLLLVSPIPV
jgi:hypothetical protein